MRLFIDENCASGELVKRLRDRGHDVETSVVVLGPGVADARITDYAIAEQRTVVTKDVDDYRRIFSGKSHHSGLILIHEGARRLSPATVAVAIENIATTYATIESLTLSLNEFIW